MEVKNKLAEAVNLVLIVGSNTCAVLLAPLTMAIKCLWPKALISIYDDDSANKI